MSAYIHSKPLTTLDNDILDISVYAKLANSEYTFTACIFTLFIIIVIYHIFTFFLHWQIFSYIYIFKQMPTFNVLFKMNKLYI